MRGQSFVAFAMAAAVATSLSLLPEVAADCSFCRYSAWNCTVEEAVLNETSVQSRSELRSEATMAPQALAVCDADGKIQVDDVFCDGSDCECIDDKSCVSLMLGCQNIFQARSRRRCIGDSAIQQRFQRCAGSQSLTLQAKANLDADWIYFKDINRCKSADCLAVRSFHNCGAVQCGRLVVAWKESSTLYRFVADGSRAKDMAAGTFLFSANTTSSSGMCSSISSTKIQDCYAPQTRNQKNGTCNGIYLQADTKLQAAGETHSLHKLSWPVWITVVGSVAAAFASVASVAVVLIRHRRERLQEERSGLLPENETECKTPDLDESALQDASTPPKRDVRQRPTSPTAKASS